MRYLMILALLWVVPHSKPPRMPNTIDFREIDVDLLEPGSLRGRYPL